jgi:SAM-dependent methyltransferase
VSALYDTIGKGYADYRKADPRIAAMIRAALGDAKAVLNVGGGTGSYELPGLHVAAIEPSATMIAQRAPDAIKPIQGTAEDLPFPDKSFDAATAFLTTHHWRDLAAGLRQMKRVARKRCVFFDQDFGGIEFWLLRDYFPDMLPTFTELLPLATARAVFGEVQVIPVPVPHDCTDGFFCAYWRRPEAYLDPGVRAAISFFAAARDVEARIERLRRDLEDGTWMRRNGYLMEQQQKDYGYRLVIADIGRS